MLRLVAECRREGNTWVLMIECQIFCLQAVVRELKSRQQPGNDLIPANLVSEFQSLRTKLGDVGVAEPARHPQTQEKDVVNSAVLFCEGAVNLLKAALSPRSPPQVPLLPTSAPPPRRGRGQNTIAGLFPEIWSTKSICHLGIFQGCSCHDGV